MKKIIITPKQAKLIKEDMDSVNNNFSKAFKKEPSKSFKPNLSDDKGKKFNPLSENEEQTTETDNKFGKQMIVALKALIKDSANFELPKFFEKYNLNKDIFLNLLKTNHIINDNLQVYKNNLVDNVRNLFNELNANHTQVKGKPELAETEGEDSDGGHRTEPIDPTSKPLDIVHYNNEIVILKDDANKLFVYYYFDKSKDDFKPYASIDYKYIGKDAVDNEPEYEYDEDWKVDGDILNRYINDNWNHMSKGRGVKGFEAGKDLVLIDDALKQELISLYNKDKKLVAVLSTVNEDTSAASSGSFSTPLGTGSSDVIKRDIVDETTDSSSSGQYSQPAIWSKDPNNARFSHKPVYPKGKIVKVTENFIYNQISKKLNKSVDEVKQIVKEQNIPLNKLPKLFKLVENGQDLKTQTTYKDGEMVSFNDCTKLNNNKGAENGGCSVGAVDKVAKGTKTKDSLFENTKLSPQQIEQLNRINKMPLEQVLNYLNTTKINPETIQLQFIESNWGDKITFDPNNNKWIPVSDSEAQGNLANKIDSPFAMNEDDKIYEQVAKKTNKSIEEVKKIIAKIK